MNRALHAFVVAATLGSAALVFSQPSAVAQQPDPAAPAAPTTSDNPSVQALLDSKPTSPDDLFNVIGLLLDLKQPLYAKPLLAKLDQAANNDAQLNALGRKYGSRAVSRLAEAYPILKDQKLVLTKPTAGEIKAFSSRCTHQGCAVGAVKAGLIVCPCHGSKFAIADGAPKDGPAQKPLEAAQVKVSGDKITLA